MQLVIFKKKEKLFSLTQRALKWHLGYHLKKRPRPMGCGFYITNRCNFRCDFCNIWRKVEHVTLPFEKARRLVDDLSELGCFYFSVTGGEPLLVDYIFDFLSYAKKSNIGYLHLVTNGYLIDQDKATRLQETGIDEVSISIDASQKIHDARRGVAGAYAGAIKAIENMREFAPKVNIVLNSVFFPENAYECLHVLELAHRFGIYMKIQPVNRHPAFNKDNSAVIPLRENLREKEKEIKRVIGRLRADNRVANSKTFLDNLYNFYFRKDRLIFRNDDCIFGYHHLEVLENGTVFPCLEALNWEKGTKFDRDLKDILSSAQYGRLLEDLRKCKGCQNNYYICYYESRITFPLGNFIRFHVKEALS